MRRSTAAPARSSGRRRAARLAPGVRRAHLLACALRVFAARGLGAARPADVAAEAGVALPTVFHYFATREALVDAVLHAVERTLGDVVERVARRRDPAPVRLAGIARAFAHTVDRQAAAARVWLDWSTAAGGELWPRYLAYYDRIHAVLAATIRRGQQAGELRGDVPAADAARLFIASAYVIMQMKLRGRPRVEVDRLLETLPRLFAVPAAGDR
jgi:TetR/AcrR family transcriptional regulator, hemagglutinin/protease regulatory protein